MVSLDLVRLGWIADYVLGRCDSSELALAISLTSKLGKGDLLIADRLYFDSRWFLELDQRGLKFLFRVTSNRVLCFTKEGQQAIDSMRRQCGVVDCVVDLKVDTDHKGRPKHLLRCRYIEIPRPGAETLRFITNLSSDYASTQEIAQLYMLRWGIETDYRFFKGPDHLPVVLSRKENSVKQEILMRVLAHNSIRYLQAEACQYSYLEKEEMNEPILAAQPSDQNVDGPIAESGARSSPETTEEGNVLANSVNNEVRNSENTQPIHEKWRKRHLVEKREILPIDLRIGPTAALLVGNILYFAIYPDQDQGQAYSRLLLDVLAHEIMAKPGRHYPRYPKRGKKPKHRGKGNRKTQYRRKKERRHQSKPLSKAKT